MAQRSVPLTSRGTTLQFGAQLVDKRGQSHCEQNTSLNRGKRETPVVDIPPNGLFIFWFARISHKLSDLGR